MTVTKYMITHKHAYKGTLIACLTCFKKKSDPIHDLSDQPEQAAWSSTPHAFLANDNGFCITCGQVFSLETHLPVSVKVKCVDCGQEFDVPERKEGTFYCNSCFERQQEHNQIQELGLIPGNVIIEKLAQPLCKSHACSKCGGQWTHDYECKRKEEVLGLCERCATQNAAEINRPKHIEEIKQANVEHERLMTNQEQSLLAITHEEFVVLNLLYHPSKDNPSVADLSHPREDWQAKLSEHILQLERIQLQCRIKLQSAHKARVKKEVQDLNRLTPEEQEQYKRDAAKQKKAKADKPAKTPKATPEPVVGNKRDKAIVSMLKLMGKTDTPANRKLIEDMLTD